MLIYRSASMVYMSNTGQTLTRQQVIAIRKQRAAGHKIGDIARGYRVSRKTVSRVVNWQSHKIVQDILFPPIPSSPSEDYLAVLAGQRQWIATTNFAGCPGQPQIALRIAPCSLPRQSS